jgi:amino acid transporter
MVSAVWWSGLFGYLFLCAFILMIPDMNEAASQGWNVFFWAFDKQVPAGIKEALYVTIFISQWLCGLATVTSVSRMLYAFSRDGGMPGISGWLAKVSPRFRVPQNAIWFGSILSVAFVGLTSLPQFNVREGVTAYSVVVSCTVIFLFLSFAVPIALALFAYGGPKFPKPGPWDLGAGMFRIVSVLSIISMCIIFFIGIQPPNDLALPITVGFIVLSLLVWFLFENRRFKGPPIGAEIAKRAAEIKAAEAAVGETA